MTSGVAANVAISYQDLLIDVTQLPLNRPRLGFPVSRLAPSMKKLILVLFAGSMLLGRGDMTLVTREPFVGPGALTSGAPGASFTSVTGGDLTLVRVGPRTSAITAPGWSADVRTTGTPNVHATVNLAGNASLCGMWGAWIRIKSLPPTGGYMSVLQLINRGDNVVADFTIDPNGVLTTSPFNYGAAPTPFTGPTIAPNTWVWIGVAWQIQAGANFPYGIRCLAMPLGGHLCTWGSGDHLCALSTSFSSVNVGLRSGGPGPMLRIGCPSLYALGSLADVAYPCDVLPPVEQSYNWYVDPVAGNDCNDGATPATAWKSAAKITLESHYCGMLDSNAAGPGGGDVMTIDTSATPLVIGNSTLTFATQGLKVAPVAGQTRIKCQAEERLDNGAFTLADGLAKTYQTADTQTNICAWEDDKWMWHVKSASYGATAVVRDPRTGVTTNYPSTGAALDATPGSFYTDGTTLYLHPFGDTDPNTDGKCYTRSINRGGGLAAVAFTAGNYRAIGFDVRKTTLVDSGDNDFGAYCFQDGVLAGSGFSSSVENGYFAYGDKHCFGSTTGVTNSTLLVLNTECEQGHPYCGYGGQTPFVSYTGATTGDITHIYEGCTCLARSGLIGSTAGDPTGAGGDIILSHNNGGGVSYASITLDHCNFASGSVDLSIATNLSISNTQLAGLKTSCPINTCTRCLFTNQSGEGVVVDMLPNSTNLTMQNCIVRPTWALGAAGPSGGIPTYYGMLLSGTAVFQACTFDLSGMSGDAATYFLQGFIQRTGLLNLTFQNNAYIVADGEDLPLLYNASATDTMTFDHNAYELGSGTVLARAYDGVDQTFAAWQALGKDCLNSNVSTSLGLADDVPQAGSPLLNAGVDLGAMADYTGATFAHRTTIGAYQGDAAYHAPQTIAGLPVMNSASISYSPINLPPVTDSGLPITYEVVSGPAQINGNVLTATDQGTVLIRATQAGDDSNAALNDLEILTVTPPIPATDTPTLPVWALLVLGGSLAVMATRTLPRSDPTQN